MLDALYQRSLDPLLRDNSRSWLGRFDCATQKPPLIRNLPWRSSGLR